MDKEIRASYRITEEDFLQMSILHSECSVSGRKKLFFRIIGAAAAVGGAAAFINIRGNIFNTVCWFLLIASGLFLFSYFDVIDPFLAHSQAKAFYRYNGDSFNSKTVIFTSYDFRIDDEYHKLSVPIDSIYMIAESKNTLLIYIDIEEYYFIPKRVLDEEKLALIKELVGEEKYKKEV